MRPRESVSERSVPLSIADDTALVIASAVSSLSTVISRGVSTTPTLISTAVIPFLDSSCCTGLVSPGSYETTRRRAVAPIPRAPPADG